MEDPVVVRTYLAVQEAEFARAQLEADGIVARVEDAAVAGIHPLMTSALGGVRLVVERSDATRAAEILEAIREGEGVVEESAPGAPEESSVDAATAAADADARRAMIAAIFGVVVLPVIAQVYSLYKLVGIDRAKLSPTGRTRWNVALGVDLAVLALAAWLIARSSA